MADQSPPVTPLDIPHAAWPQVLRRSVKQIGRDGLTDRAGALTYYGVLAIFPALLVLVSVLGMLGEGTAQRVLDELDAFAPTEVRNALRTVIHQVTGHSAAAGAAAVAGLLVALWSASAYVASFTRAMNAIYRTAEGRPFWRTMPLRLGVTVGLMVVTAVSAVIVTVTGPFARQIGGSLGVGDSVLLLWNIAKWPVLVVIVSATFSVLYWATPNVKQPGVRWVSAGGLLAVLSWLVVSGGFGLYVSFFGSYNKTYGSLATGVVFLIWLWLTNLAVLLGAEFNSELERERAILAGLPPDTEPFVPLRDTRKLAPPDLARALEAERIRLETVGR